MKPEGPTKRDGGVESDDSRRTQREGTGLRLFESPSIDLVRIQSGETKGRQVLSTTGTVYR